MCGVIAARGCVDRSVFERALRTLDHRGPDGRGSQAFDGAILGHTRLALVDVDGGAQPIESEDGTVACVVSGELYDDDHIRADLESRGHRFRTHSDSEIVVHLYEEHGEAFVSHLRGEFAVIIWDAKARRLVCARDRFGVRPLVWARGAFGVAVASQAKALFALGVRPRWDESSLWMSMSAQYTLPDRTLFEGVNQLPPGCLLIVDGASSRVVRYWDIDFPRAEDKRSVSPAELRAALDEAVTVRMRGDHRGIACALSGGVDSSAVALLATRRRAGTALFSLSFPDGGDYDEVDIATRTAAHFGAPLTVVDAKPSSLWEALPKAVAESEGLAVNLHLPAKWLLAQAVKRAGISVLLTGEGADETLAGYAHFQRDLLIEQGVSERALASQNRASAGLMMPSGAAIDTSAVARVLGFVPSFIEAKAALGHRATSLLATDFITRFAQRDAFGEMVAAFDLVGLRGRERIDQSSYLWCKLALAGYILRTLGDGTEMAHAVEGRVPFLDQRFFDVVRHARTSDKIHGTIEKHVLRAAMNHDVPEEVTARRKHPLLAPPLQKAVMAEARELLFSHALPAFFDVRRIEQTLDRLARTGADEQKLWDAPLMLVITTTLLAHHYGLEGS